MADALYHCEFWRIKPGIFGSSSMIDESDSYINIHDALSIVRVFTEMMARNKASQYNIDQYRLKVYDHSGTLVRDYNGSESDYDRFQSGSLAMHSSETIRSLEEFTDEELVDELRRRLWRNL